ncbi:MAG: AraC family transcriptional regulator [Victivallales bacterium]
MGNKITSQGWALEHHSKYAGRIFLKTLSNSIDREKHTVHLYAPGSIYWEDVHDADYPIQETYLFFTGSEICGLSNLISQDFNFARFEDPDNVIGSLFTTAATTCSDQGDDSFWIIQSCFMRMIHHLVHARHLDGFNYLISSSPARTALTDFSHMVEKYLRKNIGRNVTLAEIASYMKTSESLLSHKFKEEAGVSPVLRHTELRIEFVKNLILKGEKLKSVAEMTGYSDEYHLSKAFKLTTGITPSCFKKSSIAW